MKKYGIGIIVSLFLSLIPSAIQLGVDGAVVALSNSSGILFMIINYTFPYFLPYLWVYWWSYLLFLIGYVIFEVIIVLYVLRDTKRFKEKYGDYPWGLDRSIWILIIIFAGLLGLIVYLVARTSKGRKIEAEMRIGGKIFRP